MIKKYSIWNKEHPLVLEHWNLQEENGNFIFSCEKAHIKYPGSVLFEEYQYSKSPIDGSELLSYYPWEFYMYKSSSSY
jgi:hypothetical protein